MTMQAKEYFEKFGITKEHIEKTSAIAAHALSHGIGGKHETVYETLSELAENLSCASVPEAAKIHATFKFAQFLYGRKLVDSKEKND